MERREPIGGIVHTYQHYDPQNFPSPTQPPPDFISPAMQYMLAYGNRGQLTEEQLARAVRLDPSQFRNLGPSIDMLTAMLLERKRKILEKFETDTVQKVAHDDFHDASEQQHPPKPLRERYRQAINQEQLYDLERLWYQIGDDRSIFARHVLQMIRRLGDKYQVDELAAKYEFTGRSPMTVPEALEIKEELEKIDKLLKQLEEARETAQIGIIDLEDLKDFVQPGDVEQLEEVREMVEQYVREMAARQGLESRDGRLQVTPEAMRIFQGKLLERIFSDLQASKTGRHQGPVTGEGAVELQQTQPYEFGDSLTHMDIPQTLINAMLRQGAELPIRLKTPDIEVHRTKNMPKCGTVVIMDMSGSMRYDGQYINVKRMALAMEGLIRSEYPGDYLNFIEMYTFAKPCRSGEIMGLLPKPVTITDPWIQLSFDMSREDISEHLIHPHFTNIQHALQQSRQFLTNQDTPNRQVILITDGLPTAHFEDSTLMLLYPPHPLTEQATMREGMLCAREGITLNIFLVPSWSQSQEDIQFAYRLAETTKGRVFFTAGKDLDRFVVWDYVQRKREILG